MKEKAKPAVEKKTNKKSHAYFNLDRDAFELVESLRKKKDIEVYMVTYKDIKVMWLDKTYTLEQIRKMIK